MLILDNYNFDPTEKTGFSFTTQMSGNIAIRAGAWIPVSFMAQYSGTAEIRTDGQQIIACTVDKIEPVPFDSINTFLALNPNLPDSILASLEKTGIEELNSYIKDLFDTLSETESKGDKYGNLYHSTQVWFKWNRGKTALWVYKNCTRSLNTYSEITYDHSGDSLNSVAVYNQDMSSVIHKTSETATGAESGGELGWYDADPDEPAFYVHTFGADNCRTIYTFNNLRLSRIELRTGQIETNNSTSIATVTYTFYKGFTPSGNSLIRSSSYGYRKVFLQFEPGGNICSREVYEHDRHIESFLISKGYSDPDGDLTYAEQRTFNDGSYINRVYHTTGYKDKVLVLESESTSNPDGYSSTIYYDCAGNVIVTYNYQADLLDELKYAYFEPGGNNSSASVLLFGNVYAENSASWITALNTGRGLQSRRIPDKLLLLDDGHFELYMIETVSLPVPATASSSFLVSVQTKYTGSILESIPEDSLYYHLRFERCEVTGLRATSYEELYDHYNGINDGSVFFDEFGKMLVGCKDEAEFEGLMREYLEMMAGPDDVTGEAMSDIFILKGNYVETALSLITCYIDPPPDVIPITDPIVIDD